MTDYKLVLKSLKSSYKLVILRDYMTDFCVMFSRLVIWRCIDCVFYQESFGSIYIIQKIVFLIKSQNLKDKNFQFQFRNCFCQHGVLLNFFFFAKRVLLNQLHPIQEIFLNSPSNVILILPFVLLKNSYGSYNAEELVWILSQYPTLQ